MTNGLATTGTSAALTARSPWSSWSLARVAKPRIRATNLRVGLDIIMDALHVVALTLREHPTVT
jgi:hypothetical protein